MLDNSYSSIRTGRGRSTGSLTPSLFQFTGTILFLSTPITSLLKIFTFTVSSTSIILSPGNHMACCLTLNLYPTRFIEAPSLVILFKSSITFLDLCILPQYILLSDISCSFLFYSIAYYHLLIINSMRTTIFFTMAFPASLEWYLAYIDQ